MSVLLYILGLSYGGVEDFLTAIGLKIGKTTVYDNVQAAGIEARKEQRSPVAHGGQRAIIGADGTFLKVKGQQVGIVSLYGRKWLSRRLMLLANPCLALKQVYTGRKTGSVENQGDAHVTAKTSD